MPRYFASSLLRAAQLNPGSRVLDVATGTGLVAEAIADAVGPAGHVTAVDISRSMLARAEQRLAQRPNVLMEESDGQALRFADGSPALAEIIARRHGERAETVLNNTWRVDPKRGGDVMA